MNCVGLSAGARSRALRFAQRPCASFSQRFGCARAGDDRQAGRQDLLWNWFPSLFSLSWFITALPCTGGKRMQNFTLEWNVEWKRVLVRSQDRRSSQRIPSVTALNASCFICAGRNKNGKENHLVASSDDLFFFHDLNDWVHERNRECAHFFFSHSACSTGYNDNILFLRDFLELEQFSAFCCFFCCFFLHISRFLLFLNQSFLILMK